MCGCVVEVGGVFGGEMVWCVVVCELVLLEVVVFTVLFLACLDDVGRFSAELRSFFWNDLTAVWNCSILAAVNLDRKFFLPHLSAISDAICKSELLKFRSLIFVLNSSNRAK